MTSEMLYNYVICFKNAFSISGDLRLSCVQISLISDTGPILAIREPCPLVALGIETKVKCLAQGSDLSLQRLTLPLNYPATLITVGSLNGIYRIKSLFPAPTGSATESTGIVLMKLAMNNTSAEDFF